MERSFIKLFLQETRFPPEACRAVLEAWDRVEAAGRLPALRGAVEAYLRSFSTEETQSALEALSEGCGVPVYTLWLLLLMAAAQPAREDFHRRGLGDGLFWETFSDLRYKALECWRVYRVWGVFVAFWYPIFYTGEILKLGRLEYQEGVFRGEGPVTVGDVTVRPGDPVKQLHIPSSGEPLTREARLDSYRRAFARFGQKQTVVAVFNFSGAEQKGYTFDVGTACTLVPLLDSSRDIYGGTTWGTAMLASDDDGKITMDVPPFCGILYELGDPPPKAPAPKEKCARQPAPAKKQPAAGKRKAPARKKQK